MAAARVSKKPGSPLTMSTKRGERGAADQSGAVRVR
jgi:hypothetical protein